jgi:hypothetical protein
LKWSLDQLPQRPQLHDYDNAKEPAGRVVSQFEPTRGFGGWDAPTLT